MNSVLYFLRYSSCIFLISLMTLGTASTAFAEARPGPQKDIFDEREPEVETVADTLEYLRKEDKVIAKGNVVITYGDDKITADYAEVKTKEKLAYAKGHVIVFQNDAAIAKGEEVHYDFLNKQGEFPNGTFIATPWTCRGKAINQVGENRTEIYDGVFTTCRGENPPFEVKAKKVVVHKDNKLVATNVTIYSLGKPIFWWPYLIVPLNLRSLPFSVSPGYSDDYGAYVETKKGFVLNKYMWGVWHVDYRAKRGFGAGADLTYDFGPKAYGEIKGYWTQDKDAPVTDKDNPFATREDRDRGRLTWLHRTDFSEHTHIQMRYHRVADEYFLQDFFEKEFRGDIEPHSFVTFTHNTDTYGALAHFSHRANSFEALVEKKPLLRFDWKNQETGIENLYYVNQSSYAFLARKRSRHDDPLDTHRFDHVSEVIRPFKVKDWKVTPTLGVRGTGYTTELESDNGHFRTMATADLDVRNQYYKTFDVTSDKFGVEINRLRHVMEPVVGYKAVRSSVSNEKLTHYDRIDRFDDMDEFRFGVENRLQTKRVVGGKLQRVDLVSLNTFVRYAMHNGETNGVSTWTLFDGELILRPYDWLQYRIRYAFDMNHQSLSSFNQDLILRKNRWRLAFGHRYIDSLNVESYDINAEGSNEFIFEGNYKINKLWDVGGYIRFDADENSLEEWQLTATRDMQCVILDFGYNVRNSSVRSSNKELFFNLRLKDYPQLAVRSGASSSSFASPKIGETVSGANLYGGRSSSS